MTWKKAVEQEFAGWPAEERKRAMQEVAELNDFAERIGFTCHPDDRLGFGRCYFTNRHVRVWHSPEGWVRAESTSVPVMAFGARQLFHTPQQALQDKSPFAVINRYGVRSAARA